MVFWRQPVKTDGQNIGLRNNIFSFRIGNKERDKIDFERE